MSYKNIKKARRKRKDLLVEFLGGECVKCSYNTCNEALDFHHVNPKEKEFAIGSKWDSYDRVIKEVQKCILLCSNCHRELHAGLWSPTKTMMKFNWKALPLRNNKCKTCGKNISLTKKFCNRNCYTVFAKKDIPDKETLRKQIIDIDNWSKLGRIYGVSDNAVRKWAKKYNLI